MKKTMATIITILLTIVAGIAIYYVITLQEEPTKTSKVINVETNDDKKDDAPKEDEPYENETKLVDKYGSSDETNEIDLKYDQYITANGYAGASDNVYYTRNGALYHLRISTNQTTKLAEGVKKIESDLDGMIAYKGNGFKLIAEDEYVTYLD